MNPALTASDWLVAVSMLLGFSMVIICLLIQAYNEAINKQDDNRRVADDLRAAATARDERARKYRDAVRAVAAELERARLEYESEDRRP